MKNLLVAQSGGPTSAINASIAGILEASFASSQIDEVFGGINGIKGILDEKIISLSKFFDNYQKLNLLYQTPAAALGSCRFKLGSIEKDEDKYFKLLSIFRKFNINYFIYIGGNDSMDTVDKISKFLKAHNVDDIVVVGVPKTIDNDLAETDHCPGYGSVAKYIATTVGEIERDANVYDTVSVSIIEVMGRNTGWIAASSALSRLNGGNGPDLIYLCENDFENNKFVTDVSKKIEEKKSVLVVVSEGIKYASGEYVSSSVQGGFIDHFGHKYLSGVGSVLTRIITNELGCKSRSIELNLAQRCASHSASATDLFESSMLGKKGLICAIEGLNGHMATIIRNPSPTYSVTYSSCPVSNVANVEKKIPTYWITEDGTNVTEDFLEYAKPLIIGEVPTIYKNGIPEYVYLY